MLRIAPVEELTSGEHIPLVPESLPIVDWRPAEDVLPMEPSPFLVVEGSSRGRIIDMVYARKSKNQGNPVLLQLASPSSMDASISLVSKPLRPTLATPIIQNGPDNLGW